MLTNYKKLCGPKGIRGNTLICFGKWVREQCPNQLLTPKTKYIKTNLQACHWHQSHTSMTSRNTNALTVLRLEKGHFDFLVSVKVVTVKRSVSILSYTHMTVPITAYWKCQKNLLFFCKVTTTSSVLLLFLNSRNTNNAPFTTQQH